jgi:hypothetical protein
MSMTKKVSATPFLPIRLEGASPVPVHRQIYDGLREAILEGRLWKCLRAILTPGRWVSVTNGTVQW